MIFPEEDFNGRFHAKYRGYLQRNFQREVVFKLKSEFESAWEI